MASTKTQIKPIRIANETAEFFEGKPLNRYVECIHRLVESGELTLSDEEIVIQKNNNAGGGVYTEIMGEFDEMASCCGMTLEELVGGLFSLLEEGAVVIDNGALTTAKSGWVADFENACHDLCIPVEKAAAGAIKNLKRGDL